MRSVFTGASGSSVTPAHDTGPAIRVRWRSVLPPAFGALQATRRTRCNDGRVCGQSGSIEADVCPQTGVGLRQAARVSRLRRLHRRRRVRRETASGSRRRRREYVVPVAHRGRGARRGAADHGKRHANEQQDRTCRRKAIRHAWTSLGPKPGERRANRVPVEERTHHPATPSSGPPERLWTLELQSNGRRYTRKLASKITHEWRARAKVRDCTPHRFRHTFATRLLEQEKDFRLVQKAMGHRDIKSTTIYTKVNQRAAVVRDRAPRLALPGRDRMTAGSVPGFCVSRLRGVAGCFVSSRKVRKCAGEGL